MRPWLRVDSVLAEVRATPSRPAGHRGAQALELTDAELRAVLDALCQAGDVELAGGRVRLPSRDAALGPEMRGRADRLLTELRGAGPSPPRAEAVARRIGLPVAVVEGLRQSGELVEVAPGIDYPADVLDELLARFTERAPSVAEARDELGTTRRYAAALVAELEVRRRR